MNHITIVQAASPSLFSDILKIGIPAVVSITVPLAILWLTNKGNNNRQMKELDSREKETFRKVEMEKKESLRKTYMEKREQLVMALADTHKWLFVYNGNIQYFLSNVITFEKLQANLFDKDNHPDSETIVVMLLRIYFNDWAGLFGDYMDAKDRINKKLSQYTNQMPAYIKLSESLEMHEEVTAASKLLARLINEISDLSIEDYLVRIFTLPQSLSTPPPPPT